MTDQDGFRIIGGKNARLINVVSFGTIMVGLPRDITDARPNRVTWAWDGRDTLRMRFSEYGQNIVSHTGHKRAGRGTSATGVYAALGRDLRGRYPITRVEGNDVYIDISEPVS